jgi:hypothetical protein
MWWWAGAPKPIGWDPTSTHARSRIRSTAPGWRAAPETNGTAATNDPVTRRRFARGHRSECIPLDASQWLSTVQHTLNNPAQPAGSGMCICNVFHCSPNRTGCVCSCACTHGFWRPPLLGSWVRRWKGCTCSKIRRLCRRRGDVVTTCRAGGEVWRAGSARTCACGFAVGLSCRGLG